MGKIPGIRGPAHIQTKQLRIAELAKGRPDLVFTSLAHHIDVHWMHEAFVRTRKDGATGVDGKTAEDFEQDLTGNLKVLVERLKSGNYKVPPGRRTHIEKGGGKKRPIAIQTFDDKVLQRAVTMILEPLYEQDFHDFSYGFRPGRSAHMAVKATSEHLWKQGGGWVVEVDISGFFDEIDHGALRSILDQRVRDGVLRRSIDKWLRAGVLEDGIITRSSMGTPQGGVVSPLLANIFLHEVVDNWFTKEVRPRFQGAAMFRYADDIVMAFNSEREAAKVLAVTRKRFEKYGLRLHPEKTRIVDFRRPNPGAQQIGRPRPGTIGFLGFDLYWGLGRQKFWCLKKKTKAKKLRESLAEISAWCRANRHKKVRWQHKKLSEKILGHYAYFAVTGNIRSLENFLYGTCRIWGKWLSRRSQKKHLSRTTFYKRLSKNPLPYPKIVHKL